MIFSHPKLSAELTLLTDDTCVQPGYWSAIAEFIASLNSNRTARY